MNKGVFFYSLVKFASPTDYKNWLNSVIDLDNEANKELLEPYYNNSDGTSNLFGERFSTSQGSNQEEALYYLKKSFGMDLADDQPEIIGYSTEEEDKTLWHHFTFKGEISPQFTAQEGLEYLQKINTQLTEFVSVDFKEKNSQLEIKAYLSNFDAFELHFELLALLVFSASKFNGTGKAFFCGDAGFSEVSAFYYLDIQEDGSSLHFCGFQESFDDDEIGEKFDKLVDKQAAAIKNDYLLWLDLDTDKKFALETAGKYGYINSKGEYTIKPRFANATNFQEGVALVQGENYQFGYIDASGKYAIEPQFSSAFGFQKGKAIAQSPQNQLYGAIDMQGNWAIKPQFAFLDKFYEDRAIFTSKPKYNPDVKRGYINELGEIVIEPQFAEACYFSCGRAVVMNQNAYDNNIRYAYIDKQGNFLSSFDFEMGYYFYEDFAPVKIKGLWGVIDTSLNFLVQPAFQQINYFYLGFARIQKGTFWGIMDTQGNITVNPQYEDFNYALPSDTNSEIVFTTHHKGKYGFVSALGREICPAKYTNVLDFKENMAAVSHNGKWGYLDLEGELVIPFQFEQVQSFNHSIASVKLKGKWGIIDKRGNFLLEPTFVYDEVGEYAKNGVTYSRNGGVYGLVNSEGKILFQPNFEIVQGFAEDSILVKRWVD